MQRTLENLSTPELLRRLKSLRTLVDVTRDLAEAIDLTGMLRSIADQACQAIDCERASLFQYDQRRGELYTRVTTKLEIAEIRASLDQGITGHVARTGDVANVADPSSDPRWNSKVDEATGFHTHSVLAVPLYSPHGNRLLGVLELINKRDRPFDQFDEELAQAFSQHAVAGLERAALVEELRKRDAMQVSLGVAREIQRGFMPSVLPEVSNYEVATWWFPNEAVGGDYCDVVRLRDGRIGLIVADVSGHGLGPSLIMASVRAGLRALMLEHSSPEALLGRLGRSMAPDLTDGRFITMILAALDSEAHQVDFANAGHAPALHYHAASGRFQELRATGLPLGILDRPQYPAGPTVQMEVGDLVVLCTDGIVEAMNQNKELFGQARLEALIRELAQAPVAEMVRRVGLDVERHYVGDAPPDDLTLLAIRRNN